jgi:negative regulator of flagellin synthesis FlgM
MKVSGGKPPENSDVVRLQKASKTGTLDATAQAEAGQGPVADKVDVSGKAREIAEIMGAVKSIPDVRTEKVESIKCQIETGSYTVDPEKVAQRMIDEIV